MNQYADRRANAVAIVSPDPMIGALIGAAVELLGYRATFPRPGEAPADTLRRVRASHVLIDCADLEALDETLIGRGLMVGARLFVFGSEARTAMFRRAADQYGIDLIVFPRDIDRLEDILTRRSARREQLADEL